MSEAKKLPSGAWRNRLYVGRDANGKRIYESFTASTRAEANMLAAARKREIEKGELAKKPGNQTIGQIVDAYIDAREGHASPKTLREYRAMRRNHCHKLMSTPLSKTNDAMFQCEIDALSRTLSPKSVRNIWCLISSAIAAEGKTAHIKLPRKEQKEMHIPTDTQFEQLLDAVSGTPMEIPVLLAATCGMRRGEIAALDLAKDIDYSTGKIHITKSIAQNSDGAWVQKGTKTAKSTRTVTAPMWVIDKIADAQKNGYACPPPYSITNSFCRIAKHMQLPVRFHDLRHYFASVMLSIGVPDKYAMQIMGHSTPNMLKSVYQHIMEDRMEKAVADITGHFDQMHHNMRHDDNDGEEKKR